MKIHPLLVFILCLACSKETSVSKRLAGNWELTSYRRTDTEGMISYPEAVGKAEFSRYESSLDSADYNFDIIYSFAGQKDTINEVGTYKLVEKGNFMYLTELDEQKETISYIKYRILTLTRTDLEIEFFKNYYSDILLFTRGN